jgi:hypothetical protein
MIAKYNGSKLNKARHIRRLALDELAYISEIPALLLNDYEKGLKEISEEHSIILSGFLGCNPEWLRG